jgi:hypothetical protein
VDQRAFEVQPLVGVKELITMAHPPLRHLRSAVDNARPDGALMAEGQIAMNYAAATPAMFIKDSLGQAVKVGPTHVGATAPNATPAGSAGNSLGESWLDTSGAEPVFKVWDGAQWVAAGGGGGATVTTDDVAPTAPSDGDLWWDSASTTLFVWYDDGDSAQWVQIGGGGSGSSKQAPPLTAALQEALTRIETLEAKMTDLTALVELAGDQNTATTTTEPAPVEPTWSAMTKAEIAAYCQDTFGETLDTSQLKDELIARAHELWVVAYS